MQLISHQICELANRVDTLETSMRADIRTILELLQHQQGGGAAGASRNAAVAGKSGQTATAIERQNASTFQPSDSDYSLDMGGSGEDKLQSGSHQAGGGATLKLTPTSSQPPHKRTGNVQRSISQPECANERNLFA